MDYISTTDLRTKSTELVAALESGQTVSLIHRSKVVGVIGPAPKEAKVFDAEKVKKILDTMPKLPHLTDEEREARYRAHLEGKYGKPIPGR